MHCSPPPSFKDGVAVEFSSEKGETLLPQMLSADEGAKHLGEIALVSAPFAGIIGDRKNKRNIMIAMDLARGVLISFLGFLALLGWFNIYILFCLQVFVSIMDSLFNSSSNALVPDLISKDELIEANSAKGGFDAASTILGPALGGVIYGIWGIKIIFFINGVSFIISAVLSIFIAYTRQGTKKERININVCLTENGEALKFIRRNKGLLQLFTFAMVSNFLIGLLFDIILPYAMKKEVGFTSQQYGYIVGFYTAGIMLGNIGISLYFKKLGLKKLMQFGLILETSVTVAACLLVFPQIVDIYGGATWGLFISVSICCLAMGFFNAFVNTPISTNLQNLVPSEMRSRFFSILGMFSQGAVPLGCLLFGILLDTMKYFSLLSIINLLSVLAATIFLISACDEAYQAKDGEIVSF